MAARIAKAKPVARRRAAVQRIRRRNFILYAGPSEIDGGPIVAIVTGLTRKSRNGKVGGGAQVWIIRSDMHPTDAIKRGADVSICGYCIHRGSAGNGEDRSCYVDVPKAVASIYRAFLKGRYPVLSPADARAMLAGCFVRLGAYGDPAAIPYRVWAEVLADVVEGAGYTHQWARFPEMAQWCVASCDSLADYAAAKILGFRTFRLVHGDSRAQRQRREFVCPASTEPGHKTQCVDCKACFGISAKAKADIVIAVHGPVGKVRAAQRNMTAMGV